MIADWETGFRAAFDSGALRVKDVVMRGNCVIKPMRPLFFTRAAIFSLIKVLLVLDSSKFALLIDGCWSVAMETALPFPPAGARNSLGLNDETCSCFEVLVGDGL